MSGQPIYIGYEWAQNVQFDEAVVDAAAAFKAEVRKAAGTAVLATLTTANGGIVRVSDYEMSIIIPAASTAVMEAPHVYLDVVRTDSSPPQHLGFQMRVEVVAAITAAS